MRFWFITFFKVLNSAVKLKGRQQVRLCYSQLFKGSAEVFKAQLELFDMILGICAVKVFRYNETELILFDFGDQPGDLRVAFPLCDLAAKLNLQLCFPPRLFGKVYKAVGKLFGKVEI